jgi:hypothetical protein
MFQADELLLALVCAEVRFVIIGGIAVGVHGYVRATKDLDIVPDPALENLTRLAYLLREINAEHVGCSARWTSCSGSQVLMKIRPTPRLRVTRLR